MSMPSKKAQAIKQDNRKAAHGAGKGAGTKRHGSGRGGWGDPMDDLKYLDRDSQLSPTDPNYEEDPVDLDQATPSAEPSADVFIAEASYFQNFQSDVESLSAFKIQVEELVCTYFESTAEVAEKDDAFVSALNALNCPNFYNQVPKVLLWSVIASKKQQYFPAARKLLTHLSLSLTISKLQLESAFRRLFHRLNELSTLNSNAYLILVDFGEFCVSRNLLSADTLSTLQKQTEFAKDPERIERLKQHITNVISEFFASGDVSEAVRCISEMDTPFYNHEVVKRMVSAALDHGNRERELTSQFLALAVGDGDAGDYPIPRSNCELGFIILLQRVEGLYKDVPDVLELLSAFIGRAMVDEVLAPAFVSHVALLETDMGYAVIHHVKHLVAGKKKSVDDQLLNVWGANTSRSIKSIKKRIGHILKEYLVSRELDEALTAIQELNVAQFHHEIIKQLVPAVADYYTPKDLQQTKEVKEETKKEEKAVSVAVPDSILDKAVQVQLAVDLISTAMSNNIIARKQICAGFKRLRERMSDYQLDCPLIAVYYECIAKQFEEIIAEGDAAEEKEELERVKEEVSAMMRAKSAQSESSKRVGGAREREVDEMVRSACERVREAVVGKAKEENVSVEMKEFVPVKACSQVVAGTNLFVKVRVAEGQFVHVRVWCKLDSSVELSAVQWNKTEDDEIAYF